MKNVYKVAFVSVNNCFLYLNEKSLSKYEESKGNCIKIESGANFDNCAYSSLGNHPVDIPEDQIGLDALYGDLLGIRENDEVLISIANAPMLSEVHVQPQDSLNYELIEKNKNILENSLLYQVKIVTQGKTIPVRVFSNIVINLKVEKLNPVSYYGELQQRTEIVIMTPFERVESDISHDVAISHDNDKPKIIKIFELQFPKLFNFVLKQENDQSASFCENSLQKKCLENQTQISSGYNQNSLQDDIDKYLSQFSKENNSSKFRISPLFYAPKEIQQLVGQNCSFATRLPVPMTVEGNCCFKIFCMVKLIDESVKGEDSNLDHPTNFYDHIFTYIICFNNPAYYSSDILYVPNNVMKYFNVRFGSKVSIKRVKPRLNIMKNDHVISPESFFSIESPQIFPSCIEEIFKNVVQTVTDNIRVNQKINSLIIGSSGSGKTYLVTQLENYFRENYLFVEVVYCKTLRKLKISHLEKNLITNMSECCLNQPSVIILDDLDSLIVEEDEGNPYSSMYRTRVAELITELIDSYQKLNDIFFIATGTDVKRFKEMSTDRGPITFESIHEISELTSSERVFLLNRLIDNLNSKTSVDASHIEYVANKTKGYNIQDLVDLIELAEFKSYTRLDSKENEITREDFDIALEEKVPLSLYGVHLQKKPLTKWKDIGGMEESKTLLKEMFEWPVKYQELYKSCPLRLQSGVLLYGAPGTGKTLIAGAVANEFGLNFISIKGPEVFSKYIGASEQGIRDLFNRAKKAKPCLLFFDEFESLARRRGNSNEDVNDRVVNQLLTELDGVEELTGVYILAASSRPDLIDPALLRPGRIDKIVQCKLPTENERLDILKVLSRSMKLSDDVDLQEISTKTVGYSGADLRVLLYSALAVLIKEIRNYQDANSHSDFVLKQIHLLNGLCETKPSISKEEREKYNSSFETFVNSSGGKSFGEKTPEYQQRVMFA